MKKMKFISLILALALTLQIPALPAAATQADAPEENTAESTMESTSEGTQPETTEATVAITIPEHITGDASVKYGCHTINGASPLASEGDYIPDAKAAILYEIDSQTLLYGYKIDEKLYPASMTKVMTCLLALELGNLEDVVSVEYPVLEGFDYSTSSAGLTYGEEFTLEQLLYCLMVASANDAAIVIADHVAGSVEAFVEKMNEKAAQIGCTNTHFVNVHGLHDEEHYTTARDMARIMLAALEHEKFRELCSTVTYEVPATSKNEVRQLNTTNYLLVGSAVTDYYDSRVIGGKTGHTTPAGRCLVTLSESGGMRLVSVVMGAGSPSNSTSYYSSFSETKKLLDFGYNNYKTGQILTTDQYLGQFPVTGGEISVQGMVNQAEYTVLPGDIEVTALRYDYELDNGSVTAPVSRGQALGVVRVWYQNTCLAQDVLYAATDVDKAAPPATEEQRTNPIVSEDSDLWHIVLVVVLVLLAVLVLLLVVSRIRSAMLRAKRRRRREAMRKRAAQQKRADSRRRSQ